MMDGFDKKDREREEIYSKAVRAGKRTYFFDVKATRKNDYYITITESKKRYDEDGHFHYEKHKIFLYKEDFDKFADGLEEVISYIKQNQPEIEEKEETVENSTETISTEEYTNVEFEDLSE